MSTAESKPRTVWLPTHLDLPDRAPLQPPVEWRQSPRMPTHLDLPENDDSLISSNFREHPQSLLLTEGILPVLQRRHPDGRFAIGQDSLIYWCCTDPPARGAKAPDWFYVPDVAPQLEGQYRRSYVLWQELISPEIVLEFISSDGSEERDRTPWEGKYWVYENVVRATYYGLFEVETGRLEAFHLVDGEYQPLEPNTHGHFPIRSLGIALGVWQGIVINEQAPWMRWFDAHGRVLPVSEERVAAEYRRAETLARQVEAERQRAERLAQRLRELGVDPDAV